MKVETMKLNMMSEYPGIRKVLTRLFESSAMRFKGYLLDRDTTRPSQIPVDYQKIDEQILEHRMKIYALRGPHF